MFNNKGCAIDCEDEVTIKRESFEINLYKLDR